jgi:hypothetical protein
VLTPSVPGSRTQQQNGSSKRMGLERTQLAAAAHCHHVVQHQVLLWL